jgi:hypothetical protein
MGHFVPGFDDRTGNPVARAGYMVPCKRSADCYTRCPAHPLTGDRFQCQKRYKLYDIARTNSDGEVSFLTLGEGDATAFDPDPEEQARTGEYGLCVDLDYSHQQGCKDKTLSAVMDGAIGCFDRQVSMFLCGLELNIMDGDASTATLEGSFLYDPPRMLVAAGPDLDGDGLATPEITCSDPSDCSTKYAHHHHLAHPPPGYLFFMYSGVGQVPDARAHLVARRGRAARVRHVYAVLFEPCRGALLTALCVRRRRVLQLQPGLDGHAAGRRHLGRRALRGARACGLLWQQRAGRLHVPALDRASA